MPASETNLLIRLHKWAVRQDENFLTESFAHLLEHLIDAEPEAACQFLAKLTNGFLTLKPSELRFAEIRTQIVTLEGTPDLEIRLPKQAVLIEVKSESEPNPDQLRRYRRHLMQSGVERTSLILLTRYPAAISDADGQPDLYVRWYQVAEWLDQERKIYTFQAVSQYLVDQLLDFFGFRNMTMGQVTWELAGGVRSLRMLTDMLHEAAAACGVPSQIWANAERMGVRIAKRRYWFGVRFDRPEILVFSTDYARIDKEKAAQLTIGEIYEWTSEKAFGYRIKVDLNSEDVHFFARSKASQLQFLEEFLREGLATIQPIEIASAAPPIDADLAVDPE